LDTLFIRGLRLEAMIGIYRRERTTQQPVEIDLCIALPSAKVFTTGRVGDTIDYATLTQRLAEELQARRFGLVEELAERIAQIVRSEFDAPWVRVSVAKLGILRQASQVGVVIERGSGPEAPG
jgi:dihydroneopterin aldolase